MRKTLLATSLCSLILVSCNSKPQLLSGAPGERVPINTELQSRTSITTTPPPAKPIVTTPNPREFNSYRYHFAYNSSVLLIPATDSSALVRDALAANVVHVRGRTDGDHYTAGDEQVARSRAMAARDYLVGRGVEQSKIKIDFLSGGGYIAPNDSAAGRALNRRVEIKPAW